MRAESNQEIAQKLLPSGVSIILVKGNPGAGKTSLAMKLFELGSSGSYFSTRVGVKKFLLQNPSSRFHGDDASKMVYEDVRFESVEEVVTQVTKAIEGKKEIIVLDSWDTLTKEMARSERFDIEKKLAGLVDQTFSKLVFVAEGTDVSTTDYLADAVVTLERTEADSAAIRLAKWEKLRGFEIERPRSLFTLKEGVFEVLQTPNFQDYGKTEMTPVPNSDTHYSTGSEDLDGFLGGGLEKGSITLVEFGKSVGPHWHNAIYATMRANFILNGGSCAVVPTLPVGAEDVVEQTGRLVGEDKLNARLAVFTYIPQVTWKPKSIFELRARAYMSPEDQFSTFRDKGEATRQKGSPILWMLGLDTLQVFSGADDYMLATLISKVAAEASSKGDAVVITAKPSSPITQKISDSSDAHLKLEESNGVYLLQGKKPPTNFYGAVFDYAGGYPRTVLTKIV